MNGAHAGLYNLWLGGGGGGRGGGGWGIYGRRWATALTLLRSASIDGAATTLAGSAFHDIMVFGRKE